MLLFILWHVIFIILWRSDIYYIMTVRYLLYYNRVVFNEVIQSNKNYMRDVTVINPDWLCELAPGFYQFGTVSLSLVVFVTLLDAMMSCCRITINFFYPIFIFLKSSILILKYIFHQILTWFLTMYNVYLFECWIADPLEWWITN